MEIYVSVHLPFKFYVCLLSAWVRMKCCLRIVHGCMKGNKASCKCCLAICWPPMENYLTVLWWSLPGVIFVYTFCVCLYNRNLQRNKKYCLSEIEPTKLLHTNFVLFTFSLTHTHTCNSRLCRFLHKAYSSDFVPQAFCSMLLWL